MLYPSCVVQGQLQEVRWCQWKDLHGHFLLVSFNPFPAPNLFIKDDINDNTDDNGDWEDNKVRSVSGDDYVDGHLRETLLCDQAIGLEMDNDIGKT